VLKELPANGFGNIFICEMSILVEFWHNNQFEHRLPACAANRHLACLWSCAQNATGNMPIGHTDRTSKLFHRPRDENSRICAVMLEITRKLCVHDHFAVIGGRRSVHEMQDAVARAQRKADM
jgi:hypothetical protein